MMKRVLFLVGLAAPIFMGCTKNSDDFDPTVHVGIGSPYLEEVLVDKGIDSDGKINQRALKEDVEKVEE